MYDVVIIGAGSAGLAARKEVAKKTENYVLISSEPLGTTCARVGCMPSKALIEAANIYHHNYKFEEIGVMGAENLNVNHQRLMEHVRHLRNRFVQGVLGDMDEWAPTHFISGKARILDSQTLSVEGKEIRFKKLIIATGSSPVVPEKWKDLGKDVYTSDSIFEMTKVPKRMAVIGTGPVGLELAQALARLDLEVFLFGEKDSMAGLSDPEIIKAVSDQLQKDLFLVPKTVKDIRRNGDGFEIVTENSTRSVGGVLLALGRKANVQGLGLENLGIAVDAEGMPEINHSSMRVKGTNAYFAGDVAAFIPLQHEAVDEGRIAGYNATQSSDEEFDRRTPLAITFASPEIAVIGQSYKKLTDGNVEFETGKVSFEKQGRAVTKMENTGRLHIYAHPKTAKILGAEIFCPGGDHIAHLLAWAVEADQDVFQLLANPYYHPSIEEGLRTALRDVAKKLVKKCKDFDLARCEEAPVGAFV